MLSFNIGVNVVDFGNMHEVKKLLKDNMKIVNDQLSQQVLLRNTTKVAILFHSRADTYTDKTCQVLCKTFEDTLEKISNLRKEIKTMHRQLDNISHLEISQHIIRLGVRAAEVDFARMVGPQLEADFANTSGSSGNFSRAVGSQLH